MADELNRMVLSDQNSWKHTPIDLLWSELVKIYKAPDDEEEG